MKLKAFRVTDFRSVVDSGWIEVDDVTALIGTNESGKTNLLMPLWKLHPAQDGEIDPIADYPRKRYNEIRAMDPKPIFIRARFELADEETRELSALADVPLEYVGEVEVSRDFDGEYAIAFPNAPAARSVPADELVGVLRTARDEIGAIAEASTKEGSRKSEMLAALDEAATPLEALDGPVDAVAAKAALDRLSAVEYEDAGRRSLIAPRYGQVVDAIQQRHTALARPEPCDDPAVGQYVLDNLPAFVYYSNYGNLDSEIYLPHVIDNMRRDDLGSREAAKARTLRVLFSYVRLSPEEILELGKEPAITAGHPTDAEIEEANKHKKEREILLTSASSDLTTKFRAWWKQGEYRFRFNADGNHFRIWVADDKRPEEIELEGRSSGLQWFLSFFLVFLVESDEAHAGCILLLDEPGHSLHPIAQQDLFRFFEGLADTNQLLYTTHSPFLVDPDHLDRVKAVYIDATGATVASANLRAGEADPAQTRSIYPVLAAVGLTVSDTLLLGCQPVIVEGTADQLYLSAIKNYLISRGKARPQRELVFVPSGGVRGIAATVAILTGSNEDPPFVLLDSDAQGEQTKNKLKSGLYSAHHDRVITAQDVIEFEGAEIEDLMPTDILAKAVDKMIHGDEQDFSEVVVAGLPVITQIEAFAVRNNSALPDGWKVDLARQVKTRILKAAEPLQGQADLEDRWERLFKRLGAHDAVPVAKPA